MSDSLFNILTSLGHYGYIGIACALLLEVIPSELVLAYGGFLVSKGELSFAGAVLAGTIGGTLAQLLLYAIARKAGLPFLQKYGKYVFIHEKHIALSKQWFEAYGPGTIFTVRFVPVIRHVISIPAGISKMPLTSFTIYTSIAVFLWSLTFIYLGTGIGANWDKINDIASPYIKILAVAAAAVFCIFLAWKTWKKRQR